MNSQTEISRTLLYQSVIEKIYKFIDEKQMQPGEQFPAERELVSWWNVSRSVLREAFHILEVQGIVLSHQGKGRFLRNIPAVSDNAKHDESTSKAVARYSLLDLYEVRQVLEMKVMDLVVKSATDEEVQNLEKKYKETIERFYIQGNTIGENDLHRNYAMVSHNAYLTNVVLELVDVTNSLMKQNFFYMAKMHHIDDYVKDHGLILDAIKRRDSLTAQKLMQDHLKATIEIIKKK